MQTLPRLLHACVWWASYELPVEPACVQKLLGCALNLPVGVWMCCGPHVFCHSVPLLVACLTILICCCCCGVCRLWPKADRRGRTCTAAAATTACAPSRPLQLMQLLGRLVCRGVSALPTGSAAAVAVGCSLHGWQPPVVAVSGGLCGQLSELSCTARVAACSG